MVDYEFARLSYLQYEKEKYFNKSQSLLKEAKEAEKSYLLAVASANHAQNIYIEGGKMTLQNFQFLEEEFIDYCQNSLRKFFIFSNTGIKNILEDNLKMQKIVEKINIEDDIKKFIQRNSTGKNQPEIIEYIPYKIAIRYKPREEISLDSESVFNIITTMQNTFEKIEGEPVKLYNLV